MHVANREFLSRGAWIGEPNPFALPKPPTWVLAAIVTYDPDLVLMPGIAERCYRLQRYNPRARALRPLARDPETVRAANLGVLPVTSILADANWHQLLPWLQTHDMWARSSDEIADDLDAQDVEARRIIDAQVRDGCEQRAVSSWFSYKVRTGQLVFVTGAPAQESTVGQPSAPHRGPGQSGDSGNASLPAKLSARDPGLPRGNAEGEDAAVPAAAVQVPLATQGQS